MRASIELYKTLFSELSTITKVYSILPKNSSYPFILLGEETINNIDTKTDYNEYTEHNFQVHAWTKGESLIPAKELQADIIDKINYLDKKLNGYEIDIMRFTSMRIISEFTDEEYYQHVVIDFQCKLSKSYI